MNSLDRLRLDLHPSLARYGDDVLFAGWVQLPPLLRMRASADELPTVGRRVPSTSLWKRPLVAISRLFRRR